ncbi:hypothetical protein [Actinomadura rupiterrae]|uniref:hypothetical protein n=1 Tax=Actinomadura rupiterrae TaxID=559627 RepID=UPI0020A26E43|nr:hypothetical protein [Actinomadura rupiterrae]MCP2342240.1 hypothetical protein [Actinomadura rupiterrae]
MALHFADIPAQLLMWQRVREYAVPPSMIETATARRAVGDWAGACAAARIDIDFDLRAVRHRYGTEFVTRLRADLRRLAPDLLRWHMPRIPPHGRLRPGLTVSLSRYGSSGNSPVQLVVRTPPAWADGGQRMSLALWDERGGNQHGNEHRGGHRGGHGGSAPAHHPHPHPDRRFRLDLHRHLWDSSRCGELASRSGANIAPVLAPAGRPDPLAWLDDPVQPHPSDLNDHHSWASARWAAEAELLLDAEGDSRGVFTVRLSARDRRAFELVAPDVHHVPTFRPLREALPPQAYAELPLLPEAAARTLPDLALLRAGLITTDRLHPLVTEALPVAEAWPVAEARPVAEALPVAEAESAPGPVPQPGDPHVVECRGEVHRIALRDGVLTAVDHDPAQLRREELLVALGGPGLPCLRAIDAVHRSPEALPAVQERLGHGDVSGALAVVEGLLGPAAVLRDGPLRETLESSAARRLDHGLFRSGLRPFSRPATLPVQGSRARPRPARVR